MLLQFFFFSKTSKVNVYRKYSSSMSSLVIPIRRADCLTILTSRISDFIKLSAHAPSMSSSPISLSPFYHVLFLLVVLYVAPCSLYWYLCDIPIHVWVGEHTVGAVTISCLFNVVSLLQVKEVLLWNLHMIVSEVVYPVTLRRFQVFKFMNAFRDTFNTKV